MSVVFWRSNDGDGDGWPLSTAFSQSYNLTISGSPVPNDETRSCTIVDAAAGTVINLYDDPQADKKDDWTQILVRARVTAPVVVDTFETSTEYGGGSVVVTYHKNNGLDGKVSCIEIVPPA